MQSNINTTQVVATLSTNTANVQGVRKTIDKISQDSRKCVYFSFLYVTDLSK